MKADKIYAMIVAGTLYADTKQHEVFNKPYAEYIRKDALMEWLEQNRNQAQRWFDIYHEMDDLSAKQVWEEVIAKINSL